MLSQTQRVAALRVTRCYCSVSDMAALFLAAMPPAHILAEDRERTSGVRNDVGGVHKSGEVGDHRELAAYLE